MRVPRALGRGAGFFLAVARPWLWWGDRKTKGRPGF